MFNVGGGARISLNRALEILAGDRRAARSTCAAASASPATCSDTGADTSRARDELGYAPSTSVEEGLAAEFEWVRDCGARPRALAALSG